MVTGWVPLPDFIEKTKGFSKPQVQDKKGKKENRKNYTGD